ncbi:helix-turn-helix domain-containing protein [Shimazuella sp. AN120528]|uniref:helix-turn-helix domain-containing protein n=1 Tax=Shimazuella soli TaxID=1892854 RepID=UPI001F0F69D0|nr:helix-turn-helix domain-containing protein [Shimazuella soli]MCH5586287.1 helix-turn-helix domain-containing protein [Shimazuella soli]
MNKEDYPLILKADQVAEILSVSKRKAYEVMEYSNFPLVRVGRSKRVSRDAFFRWLEDQLSAF